MECIASVQCYLEWYKIKGEREVGNNRFLSSVTKFVLFQVFSFTLKVNLILEVLDEYMVTVSSPNTYKPVEWNV